MRKPKPPSIITVAIITTITIIFWIFFEVYQILTGDVDVEISEKLLKPLNPTLNQEVLSSLNGKIDFEKETVTHFSTKLNTGNTIENPTATTNPTPTEVETEITQATPSGELSQ